MLRVGLTGGLGSGKTFVGTALAALGCHLIQADRLGHEALLPKGEAYDAVVNRFGASILDEEGMIARRKLAALVFSDPAELAALNAIVHPAVIRREEEAIAEIARADPQAIIVVEAAILIETGSYRRFDRLILVVCAPEQQLQRAMRHNAFSAEEALARIGRQLPVEKKKQAAHYIVDSSGTKEQTLEQVREVYRSLRSLQA